MYVRVSQGVVTDYPYTLTDLRLAARRTSSFGANFTDEQAAEFGVFPVVVAVEPAYNPLTHSLIRNPPALVGSVWTQQWSVTALTSEEAAAALTAARAQFILQVDAEVDALYAAAIGNRGPEYADAERDALAYIAAGYTGTVPPSVQSWATAKSWTATEAADDIAAAATQLNGAKQAIRAARLLRKEQARVAAAATLPTVQAQWAGFVAFIKNQLEL